MGVSFSFPECRGSTTGVEDADNYMLLPFPRNTHHHSLLPGCRQVRGGAALVLLRDAQLLVRALPEGVGQGPRSPDLPREPTLPGRGQGGQGRGGGQRSDQEVPLQHRGLRPQPGLHGGTGHCAAGTQWRRQDHHHVSVEAVCRERFLMFLYT